MPANDDDPAKTSPGDAPGDARSGARSGAPLGARGGRRGRGTRPMDPNRPCLNCGDPTRGEYCATCGQRKVDVQVSVKALVMDVLEDQFILDKRLPRTLGSLMLQPGHLTVEFVNGRIVRYIHPFRLYLVSSLLFFLFLSIFSLQLVRQAMDDGNGPALTTMMDSSGVDEALAELRVDLADTTHTDEEIAALRTAEAELLTQRRQLRLESLATRITELDETMAQLERTAADTTIPPAAREAVEAGRPEVVREREAARARHAALLEDTTGVSDPADSGATAGSTARSTAGSDDRPLREVFGWDENPPTVEFSLLPAVDSALQGQVQRIGTMTGREAAETLLGTFLSYVPTMMFLLLPVFAGVLKLLYIRRRRFYAEHFVFLLHVHSVVFILATVMLLVRKFSPAWLGALVVGWILIYIYVAMKRVYGQSWLKTFVKYWTLGWMYFWILSISLPFAVVATLLLF